MSDEISKEVKKSKKISIKRIVIALALILFSTGTFYFGYLYIESESCPSVVIPKNDTEVREEESETATIDDNNDEDLCDIDELITDANNYYYRIFSPYTSVFESIEENSVFTKCRDEVKEKIQEIVGDEIEKGYWYDANNVAYLIDNIFLIYGFDSIWAVDIEKETVEVFWHTDEPLAVQEIHSFPDINKNTLFFSVATFGLGGTQEDADIIENFINKMCEKELIGIWQYDTVSEEFKRIVADEYCDN